MIGNNYLQALYSYPDEDIGLNQLLELLKSEDQGFLLSLEEPVDLSVCDEKEINYLTKTAALIDYYLQLQGKPVPDWLRNEELCFDKPYYHSRRLDDFGKLRLLFTSPGPFRARNVYFDLESIKRV